MNSPCNMHAPRKERFTSFSDDFKAEAKTLQRRIDELEKEALAGVLTPERARQMQSEVNDLILALDENRKKLLAGFNKSIGRLEAARGEYRRLVAEYMGGALP